MSTNLGERFTASSQFFKRLAGDTELSAAFDRAVTVSVSALRSGNKIMIAGNGGSASDGLHFAGELVGRFQFDRPGLPCIALAANSVNLTCIGNDYSFADIFSRQVRALGRAGDVLIAISTSGNSENIIRAAAAARDLGIKVIGLSGRDGGKLAAGTGPCPAAVDINILVRDQQTPLIQEAHITILHELAGEIERQMFTNVGAGSKPAQQGQP